MATHFHLGSPGIFWLGASVLAWVAFQSVTGRFYYRGGPPGVAGRREENPRAFWVAMAFEGLIGLANLGAGLPCFPLEITAFGILAVVLFCFLLWVVWVIAKFVMKYPLRLTLPLGFGLQKRYQRELAAYLATHPEDRHIKLMLANNYEETGQRAAAWDLYSELAQMDDRWGRGARAFLKAYPNREAP